MKYLKYLRCFQEHPALQEPYGSLDPSSICLPGCERHVPFPALLSWDMKQFLAGEQKAMKLPLKDEICLNAFYVSSGFGIGDAIVPAFPQLVRADTSEFKAAKEKTRNSKSFVSRGCCFKTGLEPLSSCFAWWRQTRFTGVLDCNQTLSL